MGADLSEQDAAVNYSSTLEEGDYVPYLYIERNERVLDIQNKATRYSLLISVSADVTHGELNAALKQQPDLPTFFILPADVGSSSSKVFVDANAHRLFHRESSRFTACLCDRNLKIKQLITATEYPDLLGQLPAESELPPDDIAPPVLVIPNAISAELAGELIAYSESGQGKATQRNDSYKSREHMHPSGELVRRLDDKLCKSVLPEIAKVFFSEITHREKYKICCYDADDKGCFGKHRDTIDPYLHRRYAMSLILNDDYEGGGICFPEYSSGVFQAPKYSAVIFPGSLFHQVLEIGAGKRFVVISFFFTDADARPGKDEQSRFTVERDLVGIKLRSLMPGGSTQS